MSQIFRHHRGPVTIDVSLLDDIEHTLAMDTAAPRGEVAPAAERVRSDDYEGRPESTDPYAYHDYLRVPEVDAIQRLRGWHRAKRGTVVVNARWLAEARNILDTETYNRRECEDLLSDLSCEGLTRADPLFAAVAAAVDANRCCERCEWCAALIMRDRIDQVLDRAGFDGGPYYNAYMRSAA